MNILPVNPRYGVPGISWSDLQAIESNPKRWLEHKVIGNDATRFGTFVHAQIKHGKIKVPHGNHPEESMKVPLLAGKDIFYVCGQPDDYDDECLYEYKSATKLWGRRKAEEHGQLPTYVFLIWKSKGIFLRKAKLVSLETTRDHDIDETVLTGLSRVNEVGIGMKDVLKIQARFVKAYNIIKELLNKNQ